MSPLLWHVLILAGLLAAPLVTDHPLAWIAFALGAIIVVGLAGGWIHDQLEGRESR